MRRNDHRSVSQLLAEKSCGSSTSGRHFWLFTWPQFWKTPFTSLRSSNLPCIKKPHRAHPHHLYLDLLPFWKAIFLISVRITRALFKHRQENKKSFILIWQRLLFLIEKWKTYLQKKNTSRKYRWQTWHLEYFCFPPLIEFVSCRCGRMFQT